MTGQSGLSGPEQAISFWGVSSRASCPRAPGASPWTIARGAKASDSKRVSQGREALLHGSTMASASGPLALQVQPTWMSPGSQCGSW